MKALKRIRAFFGSMARQSLMAAVLLSVLRVAAAEPSTIPVDLITHDAVLIRAASSEVWPYIVKPEAWKQGVTFVPVSDGSSKSGQRRYKAIELDDPETVYFFAVDLELIEGRRRTIRLDTVDGGLIGYASWVLTPQTGGTLVEYHVYSLVDLPLPQSATEAERQKIERDYQTSNRQRFANELEGLKRLVEAKQEPAGTAK